MGEMNNCSYLCVLFIFYVLLICSIVFVWFELNVFDWICGKFYLNSKMFIFVNLGFYGRFLF